VSTKIMPRLLVLSSTYPRWKGDHEPAFVHELSRRLTRDFDVYVLCPSAPSARQHEILDDVYVQRYRYAHNSKECLVSDGGIITNLRKNRLYWLLVPGFLFAQLWSTWRAIRKLRPDVIHAHWLVPQGLTVAVLGAFSKKVPPFVVTSHGADLFALRSWPLRALKRFVARRAASMTVVSNAMLTALEQQGIRNDHAQVQPMGVDLCTQFVPDPSIERNPNEILFVGRLVKKKGLRYLLEAMPKVLEKHPRAFLTIAGFGPDELPLRRKAYSLGVSERVQFLGAVTPSRLPDLYRRATLFVAPFVEAKGGDQEGLGLVTVEAIGCGCPVIVSDLPAVADVIEDASLRVRPADRGALASTIIAQMNCDANDLRSKADRRRQHVLKHFDWSVRAQAYARLLSEMRHS
jgi:glycosyltransferase involved in cell wall biosynthesis